MRLFSAIYTTVGNGQYGRAPEDPNCPPPTVDGQWVPSRCPWTGVIVVYWPVNGELVIESLVEKGVVDTEIPHIHGFPRHEDGI